MARLPVHATVFHTWFFTIASTTMKFDITEGTYVNKKDKAFVDYLVKCGKWEKVTVPCGKADT